jgi:hypothetical protein
MNENVPKPEKIIRNGKVAVIVSPGYGSGWATGSLEHRDMLLFDRAFVLALEAGVKDIEPVLNARLGPKNNVYPGGWCNCEIEWLDQGTRFSIQEYDGAECLFLIEEIEIIA